ncbi:MAG TPA: MotA/TolQ/ExbB proton channel family protein [Geobacteraceae bacterium]
MMIWNLFKLGGPVMWLLLVTSVVALSIILDRCLAFFRWRQKSDFVLTTLEPLVKVGSWDNAVAWCASRQGPFSNLAYVYLQNVSQPREVREDLLRREGLIIVGHLDRGLRRLAMLSQVSTLLGLLGTFHVMIMRVASGQVTGTSGLPTTSVWECFLTTMYGLLIAIPCSLTYQLLEERLDHVTRELDILVSRLEEWGRYAKEPHPGTE